MGGHMAKKSAYLVLMMAGLLCNANAPPAPDESAVERAMRRGLALFLYDQAAWVSSDDLLAKLPAERRSEIGGWVISPRGDKLHVDFFEKMELSSVVYSVDVSGRTLTDAIVYSQNDKPALQEPALRMAHALIAARAEMARRPDWHSCAPAPFNTVVLPPEKDNVVPVYFLTPQTENGSFPFGGHYEIDVAADGKIVSARAFSRSCIALTKATQPSGTTPSALVITHLLDSQPTEVHVFEQFSVGVPVYVGITSTHSMWKVENGQVTQVDDGARATGN